MMTEYNQPSGEVESLLELCSKSVSPENAGTEMQRFFQVTIWTESRDFQTSEEFGSLQSGTERWRTT